MFLKPRSVSGQKWKQWLFSVQFNLYSQNCSIVETRASQWPGSLYRSHSTHPVQIWPGVFVTSPSFSFPILIFCPFLVLFSSDSCLPLQYIIRSMVSATNSVQWWKRKKKWHVMQLWHHLINICQHDLHNMTLFFVFIELKLTQWVTLEWPEFWPKCLDHFS